MLLGIANGQVVADEGCVYVANDLQAGLVGAVACDRQSKIGKAQGGAEMHWIRSAVRTAFFVFALASPASAEKVFYLHDPGGDVAAHIYQYAHVNAEYDRVVIDGRCKSACTAVLGIVPLDKICIAPRGYFMFHAAHHRDRSMS
jgi:hypothetical protein